MGFRAPVQWRDLGFLAARARLRALEANLTNAGIKAEAEQARWLEVMALADQRIAVLEAELAASQARVGELQVERHDLNKARLSAESRVAHLEGQLQTLKQALAAAGEELRSRPQEPDPLYRRVGLDRDCPDFVFRAVRTAYRKHLHPDHKPERLKAASEAKFKDAEAVFAQIASRRGFA